MAKETYYFSHDYGSRNDPKMQKVLMRLGQEGKGVYWDLVEMLYEQGGRLLLSEVESYAFALRADYDCITRLISEFDLFCTDERFFWSESVLRRLNGRKEKSEKARNSALNRWNNANASKENANAVMRKSEGNAINKKKLKESKREEIKGKKESVFVRPVLSEVKNYFAEKGYSEESAVRAFNHYDVADWQDTKGNQVKNWKQKMNTVWFTEENKIKSPTRQMVY